MLDHMAVLKGIADANLVRRQRARAIAEKLDAKALTLEEAWPHASSELLWTAACSSSSKRSSPR